MITEFTRFHNDFNGRLKLPKCQVDRYDYCIVWSS